MVVYAGACEAHYTDGEMIAIQEKSEGNGYNFEATEVIRCIEQGKTQSDLMSLDFSLLLIDTLDAIRKEIGLVYPGHDAGEEKGSGL